MGVVSNGLPEEMTFGLKGGAGWGGTGNSRGKGLGAKVSFVCPRN